MNNTFTQELVDNINKNTKRTFYTPNGWAGTRYNRDMSVKDITAAVRKYVKDVHPRCKFSVTKQHTSSISIDLMSAPFDAFATPDADKIRSGHYRSTEEAMSDWQNTIERNCKNINHYYIENDFMISEETRAVMTDVYKFVNSFNYDDSEAMIDYFDTNFYLSMGIGKWDKPFTKTN